MKILFSISYYSPYVSGLSIYVKRLAEVMAKRGHEVAVICMKHETSLKSEETLNGVRIIRAKPWIRISKGFLSGEWVAKSAQEARSAEVVIVNLPQAEGWIPATAAKIFGKKVIAVYHCEIEMGNKLIQKMLEVFNCWVLALSKKIVAYTEDYARSSRLLKNFLIKTSYIYPPTPGPRTNAKLEKIIKKKIGRADMVIGIAARLAEEKGIEYLLNALPELAKNTKVAVAGPMTPVGEEKYKAKIGKLVEKNNKQVVFLGTIDPEKMGAFYKNIDILALPSINSTESFGMVQVEAMMMGVPVVASDLPGVRVPVQKTGMGKLVEPKDSKGLAITISEVINNRQKYLRTKIANQEFDIKKVIREWEKYL